MDTERLRYFSTIVETGSLTKASELLGISHSGLSKSLQQLQDQLNIKLVRPQGRGLEITDQGQKIYQQSQEILKLVHQMKVPEVRSSQQIGIGLSEVLALGTAPEICSQLKEPLKIITTDIGDIELQILKQWIEFGVAFVPKPDPLLEYLELGEISFRVFGMKSFLGRDQNLIPFVTPASSYPVNPMSYKNRDGWPSESPRYVKFQVDQFSVALRLVQEGMAVGFLPAFVAKQYNEFVEVKKQLVEIKSFKAVRNSRKVYLVKLRDAEETPAMKKVCRIIRKIST